MTDKESDAMIETIRAWNDVEISTLPPFILLFLANSAADEIERLRADRNRWIQCAEMLVESQEVALERYRFLQQEAAKVVRGD